MEDHVNLYCTSSNYSNCLQYSHQVSGQLQFADENINSFINRRRFVRIKHQHQITFFKTPIVEEYSSHVHDKAKTLDLSLGGMRLATETPLQNDSIIQFSFDGADADQPLSGSGYIAWCHKQIDEPGYQAGIVFGEKSFSKEIGFYLNSLRNQL